MPEIAQKTGVQRKREGDFPVPDGNWEAASAADRLKFAVRAAGGSKVVADRSGVPLTTLGTYTRGGEMKLSNLRQLADATGVTVEWLATGRGPMRPGAVSPAPAEPAQPPPSAPPRDIFGQLDVDRLALAYTAALQALASSGQYQPDARRIMQVTILLYDQSAAKEPSK